MKALTLTGRLAILLGFLLLLGLPRAGQADGCGTVITPEGLEQLRRNQEAGLYDAVDRVQADYIVRVAFHVMQTTGGTGGPSQAALDYAVQDLNTYYEPAGVQFILTVQDTIRNSTYYDVTTWAEFNAMRGLANVANAVDLFFVNTLSWSGYSWCGYSSFSWDAIQGIGIANGCADNNALVAHEVGHYFDLLHTHETAYGSECPNGSNCGIAGDLVCDTPADPGLSSSNVNSSCVYTGTTTIYCGGATRSYAPDPSNIMSYSRSACQDNFTPQQISRLRSTLVNLRPELQWSAPDLYHNTPAGWSSSLVPRNNNTATDASCAVTPVLDGNTGNTYVNIAVRNGTSGDAPAHTERVYLDNAYIRWFNWGGQAGLSWVKYNNAGTHTVRGGRHALHDSLDWGDRAPEINETNNTLLQQWVWSPLALAQNAAVYRNSPPDMMSGTFTYPNCDGFSFNNDGWWEVITVQPASATADYDIRLHNSYAGSTVGFSYYLATSAMGEGDPDWVLVNRNTAGQGTYQAGVINFDGESAGMYVERSSSSGLALSSGGGTTNLIESNRFLDIYEVYVGAEDLNLLWNFNLSSPDAGDLNLGLYDYSLTTGSRTSWLVSSVAEGTSTEGFSRTFSTAGYYALVVFKDDSAERLSTLDYTLSFSLAPPDLEPALIAATGHKLLPYNVGDACAVYDALLAEGACLLTTGFTNTGLNPAAAGWNFEGTLDGVSTSTGSSYGSALPPAGLMSMCTVGLGTVQGGRHEVSARLDVFNEIGETDADGETNNRIFEQFAWAPHALGSQLPLVNGPAPNWRNSENPYAFGWSGFNQDGFSGSTTYWTALACAPVSSTDQLNLHGYNYHSTDPAAALLAPTSSTYPGAGRSSVVVMNGNLLGIGVTRDFGVTHNLAWPADPATGNYSVELCQRLQDIVPGPVPLSTSIAAGSIVHAYDLRLTAGQATPIYLDNQSGEDLVLAVFDHSLSYGDLADASLVLDAGAGGVDESGSITAGATGWYGLVVYRARGNQLANAAPYRLRVGTPLPGAVGDLDLTPVDTDLSDNILTFDLQFPDLTDPYGLPIAVDHYDYYWSHGFNGVFPGPSWYAWTSSTASELLNFGAWVSTDPGSLFFRVVGYSADGVVLGSSGVLDPALREGEIQRLVGASCPPGQPAAAQR